MSVPTAISEMSVFCNLGRTPWVYRAFSYQRLFADAEKGPMQIALGQSDICEFESYMPSHAVRLGSVPLHRVPEASSYRSRAGLVAPDLFQTKQTADRLKRYHSDNFTPGEPHTMQLPTRSQQERGALLAVRVIPVKGGRANRGCGSAT